MTFCYKCGYENNDNNESCVMCDSLLIKREYFWINNFSSYDEILTQENLDKLSNLIEVDKYEFIIANIRLRGAKNLDELIVSKGIDWDGLKILDKVRLIAESYAKVEYKSKGADLGNYISNVIHVDDRLDDSQQIATLIHELTHHLFSEIFEEVLMYYLSAERTLVLEAFVKFCLCINPFNRIMDEYCAHSVEGRFIPHGYQNYGSFNMLIDQVPKEEEMMNIVRLHMVFGNSYANDIIDILEDFIDSDLREDIKKQFKVDYNYPPSYDQIVLEIDDTIDGDGKMACLTSTFEDGFVNSVKIESEKFLDEILDIFEANN